MEEEVNPIGHRVSDQHKSTGGGAQCAPLLYSVVNVSLRFLLWPSIANKDLCQRKKLYSSILAHYNHLKIHSKFQKRQL